MSRPSSPRSIPTSSTTSPIPAPSRALTRSCTSPPARPKRRTGTNIWTSCRRIPGAAPTCTCIPARTATSTCSPTARMANRAARGKMPTSEIGIIDPSARLSTAMRGFTLIELLVVVVILAVLAGALTLAMGGLGGERQLEREARRTQAMIGYACEQAELVGRDIGMSIDRRGYRFSRRNGDAWLPVENDELRPRNWLSGTQTALSSDGHAIVVGDDY